MHGDKWLVVFCDPLRDRDIFDGDLKAMTRHGRFAMFCLRLLKPGFRHVFAMRPCFEGWLLIEHKLWGLEARIAGHEFIEWVREYERAGVFTALEAYKTHDEHQVRGFLGLDLFSCVSVVCRLIGMRGAIFTPYALFCRLKGVENGQRIQTEAT